MSNEKDKKLDDLFKKKLENPDYQSGYREEDWDALEAMLVERKKRRGMVHLLPILSSVAALLLLILGWWLLQDKTPPIQKRSQVVTIHPKTIKTNIDTAEQVKQIQEPTIKQISPAAETNSLAKANKGKTNIDTVQNKSSILIATTTAPGKAKDSVKRDLLVNNKPSVIKAPVIMNSTASVNNGLKIQQPNSLITITKPDNTQLVSTSSNNNKIKTSFPIAPAIIMPSSTNFVAANTHIAEKPGPANASAVQPQLTPAEKSRQSMNQLLASTSVADNKVNAKTQASFKPRFIVSVVGAQDINGTGSFQQSKVGTKAGVLFSVGASKKLSLSTGTLYSNTPYVAGYDQYHFPYQFKTAPSSVTANCQMLDIPLNVGYQVYHKNKDMFTVGTGLSSYIMLQEAYSFNYASAGTAGPTNYTVPNPDKYLFKILNLNATYERQISSKAGVTVEPYLKMPLADIGYSQVKLQTAGVAVGLTWSLSSSKP